jgi:hypothetical protein
VTHRDDCMRRLLARLQDGGAMSQRSLARELGIALGLTNSLLRRTAQNGWVQVVRAEPAALRYVITAEGVAQETAMSRAHFDGAVRSYAEVRDRIRFVFNLLSSRWGAPGSPTAAAPAKEVVFYGAGEVAEVGYVCLQDCDLRLVGVVDGNAPKRFFGLPVRRPEWLASEEFRTRFPGPVVVMSFRPADVLREELAAVGVPPDRLCFL